ncbi:MAG: GH1 family beta-glucosidase [Methylococcaceae bacterium]|nr:GH1 family beta-glucosidase [Methylococcaceae bacterium]
MSDTHTFPPGFLWGAATSAYQIEGSPLADGAGPSNWHRFSHLPGTVANDEHGDLACDHYRRYADDVMLMQEIGLNAYRFSIAWSRIFPKGRGPINLKGLDFYRRLLDKLNEAGIAPYVTLHHWDLPLALDERGGWANRDSAYWFADYAHNLFKVMGGQVRQWTTLNEPWVMVHEGYVEGSHPPGLSSLEQARQATHNLLRGHALAVQAFRADGGEGQIGLVVNLEPKYAASESKEDQSAMARMHAWMNRQYLDPVLLGHYPEELAEIHGQGLPDFPEADLRLIQEPIDFLGINYYSRSVVRHDPGLAPFYAGRARQDQAAHTAMDWEIFPEGLKSGLLWVKHRYGEIPLYITENGAAFDDAAPVHGRVSDPDRVAYLRSHLLAAREAIAEGVNLKGYFAWSLFDNFEWAHGYSKRFGLIHVDYATQARTLKDSALFYRRIIDSHGAELYW